MRYAIDLAFEVSESPKPPSTVDVALLYVPAKTNSPPWAGITEPGVQVLLQVAPVLQTCVLAWSAWLLDQVEPPEATCEGAPMKSLAALGDTLEIQGTPTIFLADGRRIPGYLPRADLERTLDTVHLN